MKYDVANTFNIVSIEGGGIRGVYAAVLLLRLEAMMPGFLSRTSLFAGTSTGGILALGLAYGLTPEQLRTLYVERAGDIFKKRMFGGLWGAKYSADGLRNALEDVFGDAQLRHLEKLVLIPAFDLDAPENEYAMRGGRPKFFEPVGDARERIVDVALATSAAPTYFPAHNGYIDGGLVANNPVACAVAESIKHGVPPEDLRILSIGTGRAPSWVDGDANDWGVVRWAPKLPSIMIDGAAGVHEYIVETVFGVHSHQVGGVLPQPVAMDDIIAIPALLDAASRVDIRPTQQWLRSTGWV